MLTLRRGRYLARLACGSADLDRALALRARGFGRAAGVIRAHPIARVPFIALILDDQARHIDKV